MDFQKIELISRVSEDLNHLKSAVNPPFASDTPRRISPELRRLFIENDLKQCWRAAGFEREPFIEGIKMSESLTSSDGVVFSGGAVTNGGVRMKSIAFIPRALSELELMEISNKINVSSNNYIFKLSEYLDSVSILVDGFKINRRQIVKFMANKLGGVHFDNSRGQKRDKVCYALLDNIIDLGMTFGGVAEDGVKKVSHGKIGPISLEIMSIARNLIESPDIICLMETCYLHLSANDRSRII